MTTDRRAYYRQYYQAHKAEMLEAARKRRERDPEKYIAISRQYREQHREEINRKRREKYHANQEYREKSLAKQREYDEKNREARREYQRHYYAEHREELKRRGRERYRKKKEASNDGI